MMKRLPNILFHKLKGYPGWSALQRREIDVARIINMSWKKRYFKIFDRDKPYTLNIEYYEPMTTTDVVPVLSYATFYEKTILSYPLTKRYTSKESLDEDMFEILYKMEQLDKYMERVRSSDKGDKTIISLS